MQIVKVNISQPIRLKILFPSIKLAIDSPAYGKVLYITFQYPLSGKTELLLEQSNSGYNLETHTGLLGFLTEVNYMSSAKLKRFESTGKPAVKDSNGSIISPEGIFCTNPNIEDMYFYCSSLRVSNKSFIEDVEDQGYLLDILESPLSNRLYEADKLGCEKMLQRSLQLIDSYYNPDIKFSARKDSRGVSGFDRMSRLMNTFDVRSFREFVLSGDIKEDCYVFLSLFN